MKVVWTSIGVLATLFVVSFGAMMAGCYDIGTANHDNALVARPAGCSV